MMKAYPQLVRDKAAHPHPPINAKAQRRKDAKPPPTQGLRACGLEVLQNRPHVPGFNAETQRRKDAEPPPARRSDCRLQIEDCGFPHPPIDTKTQREKR